MFGKWFLMGKLGREIHSANGTGRTDTMQLIRIEVWKWKRPSLMSPASDAASPTVDSNRINKVRAIKNLKHCWSVAKILENHVWVFQYPHCYSVCRHNSQFKFNQYCGMWELLQRLKRVETFPMHVLMLWQRIDKVFYRNPNNSGWQLSGEDVLRRK